MPEGDSVHRAARTLQVLVGQELAVETPHPRAQATLAAERLDGRRLERVEAAGKNVLLHFEGGLVLRSHLRMSGRWGIQPRGAKLRGRPWLVLRGTTLEGVLWNGPVLELRAPGRLPTLGPDILAEPPLVDLIVARLRAAGPARALGDALLDQRVVAGIGNLWKAECLWAAGVSPWRPLADVSDEELRAVVGHAHRLMRDSVAGGRGRHDAYRRPVCPRCRGRIASWPQGDDARTAYWCPACQRGEDPRRA